MALPHPPPLGLTSEQLSLLEAGARPVPRQQRDQYLRSFAEALARTKGPTTNGAVHAAVVAAQRSVFR